MKQLFTFLVLVLFGNLLFSQEQQLYTENKVKEMPLFPGCESIHPTQKKEMTHCITEKISERLLQNMKGIDESLVKSKIYDARADIQFVISKEGILIGMKEMKRSNPILAESALLAMERISMELPPISPAKLKDGTSVNLLFQIPVIYQLEKKEETLVDSTFPVDEIMLFTLLGDAGLRYEVRLYKNKDIQIYEIKDNQIVFLGKFLTLNEVENSEPYKSLIDQSRKSNKILVADGFLDKEFYEIYVHNLFNRKQSEPVFVEVVQVENKKRNLIIQYEKEADFNESRYAPLIYRE